MSEKTQEIHLAWRGALKACGVSEADRDAISEVVAGMLNESTPPAAAEAPAVPMASPHVSWDWLRGVIKGIPSPHPPLGIGRDVPLDAVLSWIDEAERRAALAATPTGTAANAGAVPSDAVDAARYRHLRDQSNSLETQQRDKGVVNGPSCYHQIDGAWELKSGAELDYAVDCARSASGLKTCDPMDALRRRCAEILREDPETWPTHRDAPKAIAAAMSLLAMTVRRTGQALPIAWAIPQTRQWSWDKQDERFWSPVYVAAPKADSSEPRALECERCGESPDAHPAWCDNQSFAAPPASAQVGEVMTSEDAVEAFLERFGGKWDKVSAVDVSLHHLEIRQIMAALSTAQPQADAGVSDADIKGKYRDLFGRSAPDYILQFARAVLALRPAAVSREPLPASAVLQEFCEQPMPERYSDAFMNGVRFAERAQGISPAPKEGEGNV